MAVDNYLINKIKEFFPEISEDIVLETPPNYELGDWALPCFLFAKHLKKSPTEIAKEIAEKFLADEVVVKAQATGSYVNFFIRPDYIFKNTCLEILKQKQHYGDSVVGKGQKILVEYSGPNTNKPLHLGHARNNVLGMAIINILQANAYKVIKANLINDRGAHINKSLLAYKKWGYGKTPELEHKKGDHFVGEYYVLYDQMKKDFPEMEEEIKEMLVKWEAGDKELLALWKKMRKWAIDGMQATYKRMGCKFDVVYYESQTYKAGKEFVLQGFKDGVFQKEENGAIVIDLTDKNLDQKVLLRADGTALYITQDLATTKRKFDDYHPDKAVWVVGSEQDYHFKVLFEVVDQLKIADKKNLYHLSYGMVNLTTGKMKSREGTVVDTDNLLDELHNLAKEEIKNREAEIAEKELESRAEAIGLGALKYYLIKHNPSKAILFDAKESISFDGNTGPYIQYTYARIQSLIGKTTKKPKIKKIDFSILGNKEERELINLLAIFPKIIIESANEYNPSKVANFIFDLAQAFNHFYHQHSVLSAENQQLIEARLVLVECVGMVLKKGLNLVGMEAINKM